MKKLAIAMISATLFCPNLVFGQSLASGGQAFTPQVSKKVETLEVTFQKNLKKILDENPSFQGLSKKQIHIQLQNIDDQNKGLDLSKAAQGGFDSGGGTIVRTSQGYELLDLYLNNPRIAQDRTPPASASLPESKAYTKIGFDRLISNQGEIFQKALDQISKWSPSSPEMTGHIANALQSLPVYYTKYHIRAENQNYFLPSDSKIESGQLFVGAYYVKNIGVFIEKNVFDQLSEKNQIALLIHESLRQLQIHFDSAMSNDSVQKLVAKIMSNPGFGETLDTPEFMQGKILSDILDKEIITLAAQTTLEDVCQHTPFCIPNTTTTDISSMNFLNQLSDLHKKIINYFTNNYKRITPDLRDQTYEIICKLSAVHSELVSLQIIGGLDTLLESSAFQLNHTTHLGLLDTALKDVNTKNRIFSHDGRNAWAITSKVQNYLKQIGFFY